MSREITESWIRRFEQSIETVEAEGCPEGRNLELHKCYIDGLKSQLEDLREQLAEYE